MRTARKFVRRHPDLAGLVNDVIRQIEADPFVPRLRLHPLHGRHQGKHAVRLTYADRIVLVLRVLNGEITLLDIGTHDEVYRDA
ncbi:MAG: plasmid stabilization protein [Verrucomicrobia bacterium]|nr:plasmid stabilization protein [Verrucomicrobiota bacterium]MBU1735670.1 plasmid stabilization protein [Verrucomicrobiota bacterium]MBU1855493.1 plasmid stabilization protein [Verrucomicrobiota bacterium]